MRRAELVARRTKPSLWAGASQRLEELAQRVVGPMSGCGRALGMKWSWSFCLVRARCWVWDLSWDRGRGRRWGRAPARMSRRA